MCRVDEHGRLLHVEEHTGVRRDGDELVSDSATLDDATLVSMNLWGFDPAFVDLLCPLVDRFIAQRAEVRGAGATTKYRELRLPDVVGELVARGELDVTVSLRRAPGSASPILTTRRTCASASRSSRYQRLSLAPESPDAAMTVSRSRRQAAYARLPPVPRPG